VWACFSIGISRGGGGRRRRRGVIKANQPGANKLVAGLCAWPFGSACACVEHRTPVRLYRRRTDTCRPRSDVTHVQVGGFLPPGGIVQDARRASGRRARRYERSDAAGARGGDFVIACVSSFGAGPRPDPTRRGPVPQYSSEYVPARARAVLWPWRFPIVHLVGVRPEEYSKITPAALLMDISRGEENPLIHRCISVKIGGMNGSDF
jgi:hypothetical protein